MQIADDIRGVLLDIEGTTSSLTYVRDVMFPFALEHMEAFLGQNFDHPEVVAACEQIASDAGYTSLSDWQEVDEQPLQRLIIAEVQRLMAQDAKKTGLKTLQGLIWRKGFESGHLKGHVYPDVIPTLQRWRQTGLDLRIYSSGSVEAQKLYFGHVQLFGNVLYLFSGHYDTRIGGKRSPKSYLRIAEDWGLAPLQILFISDSSEELEAAQQAGLHAVASRRPGNPELPAAWAARSISRLDELGFRDTFRPAGP